MRQPSQINGFVAPPTGLALKQNGKDSHISSFFLANRGFFPFASLQKAKANQGFNFGRR
jgi:hypothetical protein